MKKLVLMIMMLCIFSMSVLASDLSRDEFLVQLNTISDMEDLQYMFEKNNAYVDIKIVKPSLYFNLDSSGLTRFYRAIMKNRPYTSIDDAAERLYFYLVLESINTNKYPVIETAFEEAEELYELNLSDLYALCETHREQAINEFTKYHSHTTMDEVQRRLDAITGKYMLLEDAEIAALVPLCKVEAETAFDMNNASVSEWAVKDIEKAAAKGFIPKNLGLDYTLPVTREKFCEIVYLATRGKAEYTVKKVESPFEDSNNEAAVALYNADIIKGTDSTHFSPEKEITREESAVIIHRLLKYLKIKTDETNYKMIAADYLFSDHESISEWAKQAVYSLKRSDIMNGTGNNMFSPKEIYTAEQAIAVILRIIK